jgi:RimJ/RimL family protein N-acetyltransferase
VDGVLREVVDIDLDAFFEHQHEPEANRMAAFPARDREAFDAHWRRLLADDSLTKKTIVYEGEVAGNVGCWEQEGRRLVGYWIGREFWGKGLATRALQELTGEVAQRPLHAWVATSNVGSIRVLEKCGLVRVGRRRGSAWPTACRRCACCPVTPRSSFSAAVRKLGRSGGPAQVPISELWAV